MVDFQCWLHLVKSTLDLKQTVEMGALSPHRLEGCGPNANFGRKSRRKPKKKTKSTPRGITKPREEMDMVEQKPLKPKKPQKAKKNFGACGGPWVLGKKIFFYLKNGKVLTSMIGDFQTLFFSKFDFRQSWGPLLPQAAAAAAPSSGPATDSKSFFALPFFRFFPFSVFRRFRVFRRFSAFSAFFGVLGASRGFAVFRRAFWPKSVFFLARVLCF